MLGARLRLIVDELKALPVSSPWRVLGAVGAVTAVSLVLAARLELNTGFDSLLPEGRASVQELRRVSKRVASLSTIFVVLEGEDPAGLKRAADTLVPALEALGPPWVGEAKDGVQDVISFVQPRAGLFASLDGLERLSNQIDDRLAYEVGQKSGLLKGLEDKPPPLDAATIKRELGVESDPTQRYPNGYYQSTDGKTVVIAVRCGILGTDYARGRQALERVSEVVARVDPEAFDPAAHWGLSGDLAIGLAEYRLASQDLTNIGMIGGALILGAVFLYYLRLRTVLAMALAIGVGLSWTFGLTELFLGHLNLATGFLFTIIGGNGINFSIIYMARYLEERRKGSAPKVAVPVAARRTWRATLTAAAAASAAYGALTITSFKGFHEFGIIGGMGMAVCWVATYVTLPPILLVMERLVPLDGRRGLGLWGRIIRTTAYGVPFGRPFAAIVVRAPRVIALAGTTLAVLGAAVTVRYVRTDPLEYDFNHIQSDRRAVAELHRLIGLGMRITGYVGLDGMAILANRVEQVAPLKAALEARRDAAPAHEKPFKAVHALQDYVPSQQREKIPVLLHIKRRLLEARRRGKVTDGDWAQLAAYLPPDDLKPFGTSDLPESLARPFTEADGTRGRVVYISPLDGDVTADARYLRRWADSFRRTVLPDGSVVLGSGRAVIFADIWDAILSDAPRAMGLSFLCTLCVIALSLRRAWEVGEIMWALGVGVCWVLGALSLFQVKMNFLNFIALPITFGIGVDYAVNIVLRNLDLKDPLEVLRRTGGAVVLCSLTTLLGYLALVRSVNHAVRSLGAAAVGGEVSCLLAAVLVLPAGLVWWRSLHGSSPRKP